MVLTGHKVQGSNTSCCHTNYSTQLDAYCSLNSLLKSNVKSPDYFCKTISYWDWTVWIVLQLSWVIDKYKYMYVCWTTIHGIYIIRVQYICSLSGTKSKALGISYTINSGFYQLNSIWKPWVKGVKWTFDLI